MKKFCMLALITASTLAIALQQQEPLSTTEVITVARNKSFSFSLESNKSTGYSWAIAPSDYNSRLVKLVSDEYTISETDQPRPGMGGMQTFTFKARKPGATTITACYKRPWEKEVVKIHRIHVVVSK